MERRTWKIEHGTWEMLCVRLSYRVHQKDRRRYHGKNVEREEEAAGKQNELYVLGSESLTL